MFDGGLDVSAAGAAFEALDAELDEVAELVSKSCPTLIAADASGPSRDET